MNTFFIDQHEIGINKPCFIIAEVAQAHDGSLGMAHAYIDAIAKTGADAIKFQTHIAAAESTPDETFRKKFNSQDSTRYAYWKRMEFTEAQWLELTAHARERNLVFLSSPFSEDAVDVLSKAGVPAWKIASGEFNNIPMLEKVMATGLPILLSTGMSYISEIDLAVENFKKKYIPFLLFQCTSSYPSPPELIGLNIISDFRKRYSCPVGLSDHSGTIYPGLAAVSLGCDMLETHVALSREMFTPDLDASVTTSEMKQLVEGIRFIEKMNKNPLDKDETVKRVNANRGIFMKSIVAKKDMPPNHTLKKEDITTKKPGTGISVSEYYRVLGMRTTRNIKAGEIIQESDLTKL